MEERGTMRTGTIAQDMGESRLQHGDCWILLIRLLQLLSGIWHTNLGWGRFLLELLFISWLLLLKSLRISIALFCLCLRTLLSVSACDIHVFSTYMEKYHPSFGFKTHLLPSSRCEQCHKCSLLPLGLASCIHPQPS